MWPNLLRAVAALAVATVLSSCGPTTPEHAGHHPAPDSQSTDHNAGDVVFAQAMIPHHQQAVEMAAMVPSRSTNPDVRVMATHISLDQQAEILTMTGLLAQWGEHVSTHHSEHGAMTMPGMVDGATLNQLQSLSGSAFDQLWMTSMIDHHQGAVTMAQTELSDGRSPDAIKLAELIISAQQREIAQMNNLLSARE
jgi:uncharacterized protein (DUF305 family)